MKNYFLHDTFLIRTPCLPFDGMLAETIAKSSKSEQIDTLRTFFGQSLMQEAIFLASPDLQEQLLKWLNNKGLSIHDEENLCLSLMRYLIRMSTRCTPFGLFAGCTIGEWGERNSVKLKSSSFYQRHTRLDMEYLGNLVEHLSALHGVQEHLLFYPNNSLYNFGDKLRYIDYHFKEQRRIHQIVAIDNSEYVSSVINNALNGSTITDLATKLSDDDISFDEAYLFIQEMIDEKVLISELDSVTTGEEMLPRIIKVLSRLESKSKIAFDSNTNLKNITNLLLKIDSHSVGVCSPVYNQIEENLSELKVSFERNRLFQTDMLKPAQTCTIDKRLAGTIRRALEILNKLTQRNNKLSLEKFKEAFIERYDKREMPLVTVLDVEVGIGFHQTTENKGVFNSFIDDLKVNYREVNTRTIEWNQQESFFLKKLIEAQKENSYEVFIQDDDLKSFSSNWNDLPDSLSVIGSILSFEENQKYPRVFIKSVNGYATHLLGRFTLLDEKINHWVCDIAKQEQALYSDDTVYAEIVHLPESRTGNVLMRKAIRKYEIPYLAQSSVDTDYQIPLSDLMISIVNNEIVLRSKRLKKRILPTLGNAHNYTFNSLPVYEFLCNLQYQNLRIGLSCSWGKLSREFKFLPRISYHNVVLFQATWQLAKEDYLSIINAKDDLLLELVTKWRLGWKMPFRILIVEGDNELFIDLTSYLSLKTFIKEIKNKQFVTLKEFDFNEMNSFVSDTEGYNYTNQFICVFNKRNVNDHKNNFEYSMEEYNSSRSFPIGADWLYYKIYCGASIADEILVNNIKKVVTLLQRKGLIEKWFFIRYADPKPHIRLRFKLTEKNNVEIIVKHIYETLQNPLAEQLINRIQTDTYEREIERYGSQTIDLSESIFWLDSETTLNFLEYNEILAEDKRWLYGLFSMDALLNAFHYGIEDKLRILKRLQYSFGKEFGMNDFLRKALNKKLEKHNQVIKSFLDMTETDENIMILRQFIQDKENAIKPIAKDILKILNTNTNKIDDLIISYIHMLHNRLFMSEQRIHELVLYDFLYKTYQTLKHSKMIMIES